MSEDRSETSQRGPGPSGSADGWRVADIAAPARLKQGPTCVGSDFINGGDCAETGGYFNGGAVTSGPLVARANWGSTPNGLYRWGRGLPPAPTTAATIGLILKLKGWLANDII